MLNDFIFGILLGFSLAMDATSIAIVASLTYPKKSLYYKVLTTAMIFAIAQGSMCFLGWVIAVNIGDRFEYFPIIGAAILFLIGINLIVSRKKEEKMETITFLQLFFLSIVTSIDAFLSGLVVLNNSILIVALSVATVTLLLSLLGGLFGAALSKKLARNAKLIGGIILIGLGIKMLIEFFF